jgi:hypothetical protein
MPSENSLEIEITPEMIDAGVEHLYRFHHEQNEGEEIVVKIFRAMVLARQVSPRPL